MARASIADTPPAAGKSHPTLYKLLNVDKDNNNSSGIKLCTIDEATHGGPSMDHDDQVLKWWDDVLAKIAPTVCFITAKTKDMDSLVEGGHADVVFNVDGLTTAKVESSTGIPTR